MEINMKKIGLLLILITLTLLSACQKAPPALEPTGEFMEVAITVTSGDPVPEVLMPLPDDGSLRINVSQDEFEERIENHPEEKELQSLVVVINGEKIYPLWQLLSFPYEKDTSLREYRTTIHHLQNSEYGSLLYRFPDNEQYLYLELPEDFMQLTKEDLTDKEYYTTLLLEIYK